MFILASLLTVALLPTACRVALCRHYPSLRFVRTRSDANNPFDVETTYKGALVLPIRSIS